VARAHQITAHRTLAINSLLQNQFSLSDANQSSMMSGMSSSSSTAPAASGLNGISDNSPRRMARLATMAKPMLEGWAPFPCRDSSQIPQRLDVYSSYATMPTDLSSSYDTDLLGQFSTPMDFVPDIHPTLSTPDNLQSQATVQNNRYELDAAWQRFVEQMGTL
jgi:hypothetical protein